MLVGHEQVEFSCYLQLKVCKKKKREERGKAREGEVVSEGHRDQLGGAAVQRRGEMKE